jgi:hypothetical protein
MGGSVGAHGGVDVHHALVAHGINLVVLKVKVEEAERRAERCALVIAEQLRTHESSMRDHQSEHTLFGEVVRAAGGRACFLKPWFEYLPARKLASV